MAIKVTVFLQRQIQSTKSEYKQLSIQHHEKYFQSSIGSILKRASTALASHNIMITRRTQQVICHFWAQVFNDPLLPLDKNILI
ncbi:hypothetical protein SADUNF_Sadunf15G0084500 [Salix dunnii]|uniref:Uncharacterized protein n=1 Tax=Salix dunnii TaxID=1413687 RepID=A0A835MNZ8_9ROSI|nr:hypothetical protein SADUNF_Sadunf15G0084500 [Salix dunnii]